MRHGHSMLVALRPAARRKAVPGVLVGRNAVAIGISKDEGAPERAIVGLLDDGGSSRFHFGVQRIDLIAVDPERHTPSRMRCFIQVDSWLAESKGDRGGVAKNHTGSAEVRIFGQAQQLCVTCARGGEVTYLQVDKIGPEKLCHFSSFLSKLLSHANCGTRFLFFP